MGGGNVSYKTNYRHVSLLLPMMLPIINDANAPPTTKLIGIITSVYQRNVRVLANMRNAHMPNSFVLDYDNALLQGALPAGRYTNVAKSTDQIVVYRHISIIDLVAIQTRNKLENTRTVQIVKWMRNISNQVDGNEIRAEWPIEGRPWRSFVVTIG